MSAVRYCDVCNKKLPRDPIYHWSRFTVNQSSVLLRIDATVGDDSKDICVRCLKKAVYRYFEIEGWKPQKGMEPFEIE